jgi:hypothetical protein
MDWGGPGLRARWSVVGTSVVVGGGPSLLRSRGGGTRRALGPQ